MFPPYRFLLESDFAAYCKESSTSKVDTDLSQHLSSYPIIQNYLLIRSPVSHYQVFRKLVFDLLNVKAHQEQCLLALNDFAKVMPKYPPEIIHPFSRSVIENLKKLSPKTLLIINLINPNLIPEECNEDGIEDTTYLIKKILNEYKQNEIDSLIIKLKDSLTPLERMIDQVSANEGLLAKMFEKLIQDKNYSQPVLTLLSSIIPIIPKSLLFINIPQTQIVDLISLIPLSLILPSDINISLFSNIQLLKFSYLVVQNMQEKLTTESVVPLHRLSLSGSCPIEAALFALRQFPKIITRFRKKAIFDAKVAFGAVLTCLLTCVEIPELKKFVLENHIRIIKLFKSLCDQVKSVSVNKSFQYILSLFNFQGLLPIVFVYSCWLGKPQKFLILDCLRKISPVDPSLPALLNEPEVSSHIINFPFLVCEIARKVIFSPSIANVAALQHLANTIEKESGVNDFILFANSILNHEHFFYATHIISLFHDDPDFTNIEIMNAVENVIIITIFSESIWSARHLDRFSRWLPHLAENSLRAILQRCQKEDYRVNCRFILMVTYMPDFSKNMITKTNFFSLFLNHINQFFVRQGSKTNSNQNDLKNSNDPQFLSINASLCIAWHNLFISIYEHPKTINFDKKIQDMFSIGAKTLVKLWENKLLHDLIVSSFCDAVLLDETRNIIIQVIGVTQANDSDFIDFLMMIDEKNTKAKFPGLRGNGGRQIERPLPTSWGYSYWITYAFGQEMSIKI